MHYLRLAAIAVLLLGACGAPIADPTGGLAGREFWSTGLDGHDLVPDTVVSIRFGQDGSLGVNAGCNSMGGTWSVAGGVLTARIDSTTDMGCDAPRMAQDGWVAEFLNSGPSTTTDGDTLILASAGITMTLLDRQVADPDQPLEGTTWILDAIQVGAGDSGSVSSMPAGVRATVRLDGDRLSVDTGCNTGGAAVTVDGGTLAIGPLGLTKRACLEAAAAVERSMTQTLQGDVAFELDGQVLRLLGPDGGLHFRAE